MKAPRSYSSLRAYGIFWILLRIGVSSKVEVLNWQMPPHSFCNLRCIGTIYSHLTTVKDEEEKSHEGGLVATQGALVPIGTIGTYWYNLGPIGTIGRYWYHLGTLGTT